MEAPAHVPPGLGQLVSRLASTCFGALHGRAELFLIEFQEERARFINLLILAGGVIFLAISGTVMVAATVILLLPGNMRAYGAAVFAVLFWVGAAAMFFALKAALQKPAFHDTVDQIRKDSQWLESFR